MIACVALGVVAAHDNPPAAADGPPHRVYNIGNSRPEPLMRMIGLLEAELGQEARKEFLPMQPGDVPATWADASLLHRLTGYRPKTAVPEGVTRFVDWYRDHYATR